MYCPYCASTDTHVLESRLLDTTLRRRRECTGCGNRFTTYEKAVLTLSVLKKDGRTQNFDYSKLQHSIEKACGKTDTQTIQSIANKVHQKLINKKSTTIKSSEIGTAVLNELKKIDRMAYLRFGTVHKSITDPSTLEKELDFHIEG